MIDAMMEPGTILLGKYRVERELGQGGMGVVVKARHITLDQPVAIKFLREDKLGKKKLVKRFLREAQAAVKLQSEHVCSVFDVGTMDNGAPFMVMQFMDGLELGELAKRDDLSVETVVDLVLQACSALAEAHALDIVHRDVKPANLFVTRRPDGTPLLKVLDFGISKAPVTLESELTNTQTMLGTPAYMSPEQMRSSKRVDARTDIWALGIVLYELLAGHRPFRGQVFSELCLQVGMDPTPPIMRPVPDGLKDVVNRCLEKKPEQRYQNMAELAAALAPYASARTNATGIAESASRTLGVDSLADVPPALALLRAAQLDTSGSEPVARPVSSTLLSTLGSDGAGEVRDGRKPLGRTRILAALAVLAIAAVMAAVIALRSDTPADSSAPGGAAAAPTPPTQPATAEPAGAAASASKPDAERAQPSPLPDPQTAHESPDAPETASVRANSEPDRDESDTPEPDEAATEAETEANKDVPEPDQDADLAAKKHEERARKRRARRRAERERKKRKKRGSSDMDEIFGTRE